MSGHTRKPKVVDKYENDEQRKQATKEAGKRYRDRNRKKLNKQSKVAYEARKSTADERRYNAPENLICSSCKQTLPKNQFPKATDTKTGYRYQCLECNRQKYGSGDYLIIKMLAHAKTRAEKSDIPFNISKDYLFTLKTEVCPILGVPLHWQREHGKSYKNHKDKDYRPSLDRVIPELGYVKGNVRIVSWKGNRLKNDSSIEDIRNLLEYMEENINNTLVDL